MHRLARRLVPLLAGAWFALLASGVLAPAPALAVCSPFVVMNGHGANATTGLRQHELAILSEARLRGDQAPAPLPSDRPRPCRGLSCSKNPIPPVIPTVPTGPQRADLWACVELAPPRFAPRSLASQAGHGAGRIVHLTFPPERPPRVA